MKIGDKVRFLYTTGGGIVKGFQGKDVVLVEDQDGFEIPILAKEVVVIEAANENQVRKSSMPTTHVQHVAQIEESKEEYKFEETKEGEQISVHLVYLADDIKHLGESKFECYFVNLSNYFLSYNYMSQATNGAWISRSNGLIEPNTKLFIEEFEKLDLNDIERICLQFIAYKKDKPFILKEATSKELRIDTSKFYKLHSFKENDFFEEPAIVYTVVNKDAKVEEIIISPEAIEQAMLSKKGEEGEGGRRFQKTNKDRIVEIDLHAHEVLESTAGLSNSDILEYQIKIFKDTIENYRRKKGQRIVFIHGKGEGVLKKAIADELRKNYKELGFQDASFQEYGFGATMVTIR